jgi:hypothetical protein
MFGETLWEIIMEIGETSKVTFTTPTHLIIIPFPSTTELSQPPSLQPNLQRAFLFVTLPETGLLV